MTEETKILVDAWIERFGEPPSIIDVELMKDLLADADEANCTTLN
ncbi:hypothetical protein QOZ96_003115 [Brevundimonas nasdae]|jgi:hypothetical protein|nr:MULTISPECIES: hypothetical protein [Brevundimonas]MDQ0453150.1 hypothetical protein [Brevundimonas nasdae]